MLKLFTYKFGSVIGSSETLSMNKGKYEWPAEQGILFDLSIVSKLTRSIKVGFNFTPRTSNLKPKNGLLSVEKSTLANPRKSKVWTGLYPFTSLTLT